MAGKVLLVGHHPATVTHRAEALTGAGYQVQTTHDIDEALRLAASPELDAVVFLEGGFDRPDRERLVDGVQALRAGLPVVEAFFDAYSMLVELAEVLAKAHAR